jgi:hypothetical protein
MSMSRVVLIFLVSLLSSCGDETETTPTTADLATPVDLTAPPDLNLGVCPCLQQLCAVPCGQYVPGMFPTLGCDRCLNNGQASPDMGCLIGPALPGQCGACYGVPGCFDPRF